MSNMQTAANHKNANKRMGIRAMKIKSILAVIGMITTLCLGAGSLPAQDDNGGPGGPPPNDGGPGGNGGPGGMGGPGGPGGNFDPAQFEQRLLEHIRTSLNVTNDDEWTAIQPLVKKVMDTRREIGFGGGMGPGGRGRPGETVSSEQQNLQKALDDGAPVPQVKAALAKCRAARVAKTAELAAAQASLQSVLSVKQEAQAFLLGLVP